MKVQLFFCDSDFLWRCDINILNQYINPDKAVFCVKHEYNECLNNLKMDGKKTRMVSY